MAGIDPSKYQDYASGKITFEQAQTGYKGPTTQTANPVNIFDSYLNSQKSTPTPTTNSGTSVLRDAYEGRNAVASTPSPPPSSPQYSASQRSAQDWINNSASGQGGYDAYTKQQNDKHQQAVKTGDSGLLDSLQADSQRVGYSFNSPYSASQDSARAWINNQGSGQGGFDAYLGTQNNRYAEALANNDTEAIGKLKADAARVGYTLDEPKVNNVAAAVSPPPVAPVSNQASNNNPSLINDIYNNNYNAQAQKLKAARDMALAGLAGQDSLINQNATSGLNNNDLIANQRMQSLKEAMANAGLSASGDNVSAQVGIGTSQQQGANDINQNRGNLLNQSMAQRNAINNNASADDLALMQQLQAARGGQLLDDSYKTRQYGLDLSGLSGRLPDSAGGGQTMAALNADRNYQLGLSGLSGQLPSSAGGGQTLAALQQAMQQRQSNWSAYKDSVDMTGNLGSGPKSDWGQLGGTDGAPSYNAVQNAIKNGMSQQQIDNSASQFAKQMGFNYANMNANDKQAWAQIAISQQNAATSSSNASWAKDPNNPDNMLKNEQIDKLKNPPPKDPNVNIGNLMDQLNNTYGQKDYSGKVTGIDPAQKGALRQAIIGMNLPDAYTDQLLGSYGLLTK